MNIYLGTDHAGFHLKERVKKWLAAEGHEVVDKGAFSYDENDDYPDFVLPVAGAVSQDPESRGIVFGGSGQGEAIAANGVGGVRAIVYYSGPLEIVSLGREHNDANILSIGARFISFWQTKRAIKKFLNTDFSSEEKYARRIEKESAYGK